MFPDSEITRCDAFLTEALNFQRNRCFGALVSWQGFLWVGRSVFRYRARQMISVQPSQHWILHLFQDRDDFEVRSTAVKQLLTDHGQALVHATINACVFCLPSYMIPDVAEVLYELMLVDRAVSFSGWVTACTLFCSWEIKAWHFGNCI